MAYVSVKYFGTSKQTGHANRADMVAKNLKQGNVGWAILGGILSLGKDKSKYEEEDNYYDAYL